MDKKIDKKNYKEFEEVDPFNPQNIVKGKLFTNKKQYGDIEISHVNNIPCKQYLFSTPKILSFKKNLHQIQKYQKMEIYDKIDGTNVLLYRYKNFKNQEFISFKTRLSPFLKVLPYGNFIKLWKKVLLKYKNEYNSLIQTKYNFVFELFGTKLRILTLYPESIDVRMLFAIDPENGQIVGPEFDDNWTFPRPRKIKSYENINNNVNLQNVYNEIIQYYEIGYKNGEYVEGAVIYVYSNSRTKLYKCKPPSILELQKKYNEVYTNARLISRKTDDINQIREEILELLPKIWENPIDKKDEQLINIAIEDVNNELVFNQNNNLRIQVEHQNDKSALIENNLVLWKNIWGSHIWGMNKPDSDEDLIVVYLMHTKHAFLGSSFPKFIQPYVRGKNKKNNETNSDEHWYELGRYIKMLLQGSVTTLYGIMSPKTKYEFSTALKELRLLVQNQPTKIFYKGIMRGMVDSEKCMEKARNQEHYLKHLRIACRNLQFGITLFKEQRYEFKPNFSNEYQTLINLRSEFAEAYNSSKLPEKFDPRPFEDYIIRWRKYRHNIDYLWADEINDI